MRTIARFTLPLLLVTALAASAMEGQQATEQEPVVLAPIHQSGEELESAALEVTRAFLRADADAALRWLQEMERNCRRLDRERDKGYGSKIVDYDQTFHVTVDRVREILRAVGDMERAFDQYQWTQKSCIDCHAQAREQGLLPRPR